MKLKLVWLLFSVLLSKEVYPQIKIISSNTKEGIPFAEIYNNDSGGFIGFSDENGFIPNTLLDKIQKSEVVFISFNHLGFKRRSVAKNELINSKTIELEESSIDLEGVTVKPSNQKPYKLIRGYHRSYNVIDGELSAYTDGWIELLYPIDPQKRVLVRRIDERFVEQKQENSVGIITIGPNIPTVNLPNEKYYIGYTYIDAFTKPYQAKLNSKSNSIIQEYSYISPDKPIINKLMGNETKIKHHHELVIYHAANIEEASLVNLNYDKTIRSLEMKRKEREKPYMVDEIREFFVFDFEELDEVPKGFGKFTGLNRNAVSNSKFWDNASTHPFFTNLPKSIEAQLEKMMKNN